MDTIFAKSSGIGKSGVAVFRISGPKSIEVLNILLQGCKNSFIPNMMYYKKLYMPGSDELIDEGMVVYFKGPHSFTGEDVAELHLHGSIAIEKLIAKVLLDTDIVRIAESGEFTKRAFLNGKFDLTAAEGLADLIEAETMLQHKQAIRQKTGELESLYGSWRAELLKVISLLEAYIDFPDEEIPKSVTGQAAEIVSGLKNTIRSHLNDNKRGQKLRDGIRLSILGKPNVGKSSLLNFLLRREAAIVSNIAGTTRDIIEGHIDINGYPIILQDTAGIRNSDNLIEQEGVKRSIQSAQEADIKIVMIDCNSEHAVIEDLREYIDHNTILVINKIDLMTAALICHPELDSGSNKNLTRVLNQVQDDHNLNPILISLKQKTGLEELVAKIIKVSETIAGLSESPHITRERHRHQLRNALNFLESFDANNDLVLATEDIRMTIRGLSNITGVITPDEILGEIFSKFCVGK
jgi:tRNA modification GTPase